MLSNRAGGSAEPWAGAQGIALPLAFQTQTPSMPAASATRNQTPERRPAAQRAQGSQQKSHMHQMAPPQKAAKLAFVRRRHWPRAACTHIHRVVVVHKDPDVRQVRLLLTWGRVRGGHSDSERHLAAHAWCRSMPRLITATPTLLPSTIFFSCMSWIQEGSLCSRMSAQRSGRGGDSRQGLAASCEQGSSGAAVL